MNTFIVELPCRVYGVNYYAIVASESLKEAKAKGIIYMTTSVKKRQGVSPCLSSLLTALSSFEPSTLVWAGNSIRYPLSGQASLEASVSR